MSTPENQNPVSAGDHLRSVIDPHSLPEKPSVGRIVHYVARGSADGYYRAVCRAAVITEVPDAAGGIASLCVLNPTGMFFNERVSHSEMHEAGTWHWPERM